MDWYLPRLKRGLSESIDTVASSKPVRSVIESRSIGIEELLEIGETNGAHWTYGSDDVIEFGGPLHLGKLPRQIREKVGRFRVDQPFVVEIEDVELVGPHPIARASDGRYLLEQSLRSPALLLRGILTAVGVTNPRIRGSRTDEETHLDTAVPLVGPWNRGFFHWFSEWLPRLEGVETYIAATGFEPTLLIPADPPAWLIRSIELLGFERESWVEWPGGTVSIDRCVLPSLNRGQPVGQGTRGYVIPPGAYAWVRKGLLEAVPPAKEDTPRRILITRHGATDRRLRNVESIVETVPDLTPFTLNQLSLDEQVQLFRDAELVIGPHGAGLTNLIYADAPTVIEGFGDFVNACYFTLSEGLGFTYGLVDARATGSDIRMPPEDIMSLLERVGIND